MKKILLSMLTIIAIVGLVGGATYAAFTATASNVNNTFSTGNAELLLKNSVGDNYSQTKGGAQWGNLSPGHIQNYEVWLKNTSSSLIDFEVYPDVEIKILGDSYHGTDGSLPDKIWLQFFRDNGTNPVTGKYTLSQWENNYPGGTEKLDGLVLHSGERGPWQVVFTIDPSAGNEIQNSKLHFDLKFVGVQKI
jgi:predicted ribosomally synthesized peptide with SipW-like signal peptide